MNKKEVIRTAKAFKKILKKVFLKQYGNPAIGIFMEKIHRL